MQGKMRKVTAGLCGLAVIAGTVSVSAPMANAAEPTTAMPAGVVLSDSNQQTIIDTFNGINAFRATKGLAPLKFNVALSGVSQKWSDTMATTENFAHNPNFSTQAPAGWWGASEIIAARWDKSGQGLVNQWINSPGHNAIMSTGSYNTVGIGIAYTDGTTTYSNYGTANLFQYDEILPGTYNSPADYFAGKPALPTTGATIVTPQAPSFGNNTYTIPYVNGVKWTVNGTGWNPGTYSNTVLNYTIKAEPLPGYAFPGGTTTTWLYTYSNVAPAKVAGVAPSFDDAKLTYTIPAVAGLEYVAGGSVKAPGVYNMTSGISWVSVTARAKSGYVLDTSQPSVWEHTYPAPVAKVTPAAPVFSMNVTGMVDYYQIPQMDGVIYKVNGVVVASGYYKNPTGTISVVAVPASGTIFETGAITQWSKVFPTPTPTPTPAPTPTPTPTPVLVSVTPSAPSFSVMDKTYTIPAKTGVKYFVNGTVKAKGTYPATGTITVTATADSGYKLSSTSKWVSVFQSTPLVSSGNLLAADASGALWNYGTKATTSRKQLAPSGWSGAKKIVSTDWNSDGVQDIVTQWKTGSLTVRYGVNTGSFSAPKTIGAGWGSYEISVGKFVRSSKYPSIIAKDTAGVLWEYPNTSGATPGARIKRSSGWATLQANLLDWDKDGNMDILAKDSSGRILLYRTDGYGRFKNETRKVIGSGWSGFQVTPISNFAGAGTQGVLAKDKAGNLYYYDTGKSAWTPRISRGAGWLPMNIAG